MASRLVHKGFYNCDTLADLSLAWPDGTYANTNGETTVNTDPYGNEIVTVASSRNWKKVSGSWVEIFVTTQMSSPLELQERNANGTIGGAGGYNGDPATINQNPTHRFTNDTEKNIWNGKQNALGFTPCPDNDSRLSDARPPTPHNHDLNYAPALGSDDNYVTDAEKVKIANLSNTNSGDNATNSQYSGLAAAKQDILVSATNIKTINSQSLLGSGNLVISGTGITDDPDFLAYQALGSPFKAQTVGVPIQAANTSSNLTDGQVRWVAVYLPVAATLTGIRVYVRVLGSYTGDNNNRIGLYSYSGGTLTLVASSANSATLWTSAANAFQSIAFSSTYAAAAGIYFVALLFNNSAQTTAPALASGTALNNAAMATLAFTNSAKLYGTSNATDLPASIASSAITATTVTTWAALY